MSNVNKHSLISGRSTTVEIKKTFCSKAQTSILEWTPIELVNTFKNGLEQKFLWPFIDILSFTHSDSLGKWAENSGVLLNCLVGF